MRVRGGDGGDHLRHDRPLRHVHITQVQDDAAHLQHRGQDLNYAYRAGATVTQVVSNTYLPESDDEPADAVRRRQHRTAARRQRRGPPASSTSAIPNPPLRPKPARGRGQLPLRRARATTSVLASCRPDDGSLAALTAAMLTDGPFCGGGDNQFDADLLRVRKVRVTLRMQAAQSPRCAAPTRRCS